MIKIDALYFLLLIELLLVFVCAAVFFLFRWRKYSSLYRSTMKDLDGALHEQENLHKQPAVMQVEASQQAREAGDAATVAPSASTAEQEKCKIEVSILVEKLKEKNKLLNDLQGRFDALEKEYLILYHQQQKQEGGQST